LSHVVNFDVPPATEDYVHRVGRTARASATGDALTLVAPEEEADLRVIERAVGGRITRLTLPGFDYRPATAAVAAGAGAGPARSWRPHKFRPGGRSS
jgi:ATP-dependent RNA helicase RhlE